MTTLEELELRLETLEKRPLPRGPAGDITAAVTQANKAVADAEQRLKAQAENAYAGFRGNLDVLKLEIQNLRQFIQDSIKNAVENHTIQVLHDYHLLAENGEPAHWRK